MGTGRFSPRFRTVAALLLGGVGCEDRARPEFGGIGNGIGPISQVMAPSELDTVQLDTDFFLSVRIEDEDGVDSVWVTFNTDEIQPLAPFTGAGQEVQTAGFSVLLPATLSVDTLIVSVVAVDLLSDTGVVFQRHLIVE
jgi:hypothetical protein